MDVITTHLNADFDGLASMVAGRKLYPDALLVLPAGAQEPVRSFLAVHDLGITRLKDLDVAQVTRLILMDAHEPDRLGPLKSLWDNRNVRVHIYDHHPLSEALARAEYTLTDSVGATVTLLIEQLKIKGSALTPFEATVLATGLYEETGFMAFGSTTPRDLEAAAYVLGMGADLTVVTDTLKRPLDPEQITLLNDLLHNSETVYRGGRKVLLTTSTYDQYRGDYAEVVQKLAELEGLDAVIAAIALDEKVEIIGRSRRAEIDVGQLARRFGGGGHAVAAAAIVKGKPLIEIREQVSEWLTTRIEAHLFARLIMTAPAHVVTEPTTATAVETALTQYGVNAMPVVDGRRRYRGLITRETIQKALFHQLHTIPVKDLMQTDAYTATPGTPFREIESHMLERNQRFVPILDRGKVTGVISRTDLLRALHHDVLAAAHAPSKRDETPVSRHRQNVKARLKAYVPNDLFALLQRAGELAERRHVSAYIVGGFVRDLLLGRPNLDLDLVIEGDGIAYARALGRELQGTVRTHDRFGTAVITLKDGCTFDIATARTEYYEYPTALPTVERSSIKKDLYRRDFTINTLAIGLNAKQFGVLLDLYGGQRDLKDGIIRVLHSLSFVEDPTRVFRAVRFEHRFGFRLGKETLSLIKGAVKMDLFHRLSGSRLLTELILLLSEEEPRHVIARLDTLDLLRFIHPKLKRTAQLNAMLKQIEEALDWYRLLYLDRTLEAWLVYWMALMELLPAGAMEETLARLAIPQRQAAKLRMARIRSRGLLRKLKRHPLLTPSESYRALHTLPDETLLFLMAKSGSDTVKRQISAFLTTYQYIKPTTTGADLRALGVKPGPIYTTIFNRLLDGRLNGDLTSETDERALIMHMLKKSHNRKAAFPK
ncbi:MAG TPA: CBS domain-containing protein [Nitrospiraceae bacterium]|nr:CBS domain-containing protein [Nitrospiraceae bacterium]